MGCILTSGGLRKATYALPISHLQPAPPPALPLCPPLQETSFISGPPLQEARHHHHGIWHCGTKMVVPGLLQPPPSEMHLQPPKGDPSLRTSVLTGCINIKINWLVLNSCMFQLIHQLLHLMRPSSVLSASSFSH